MPFAIGETINILADAFVSAPIVGTIARNPIYTALIITFCVVLVMLFLFRDSDASLVASGLRGGFWIFVMVTGIMLIHNKVLTQELRATDRTAAFEDVFGGNDILAGTAGDRDNTLIPVPIHEKFE